MQCFLFSEQKPGSPLTLIFSENRAETHIFMPALYNVDATLMPHSCVLSGTLTLKDSHILLALLLKLEFNWSQSLT